MRKNLLNDNSLIVLIQRKLKGSDGSFTGEFELIQLETSNEKEYVDFWVAMADEMDYETHEDVTLCDTGKGYDYLQSQIMEMTK